jgi:nucleoid DNA-binding protein
MRKTDLAVRLAEDSNLSPAEAADQIDTILYRIMKRIRKGRPAVLPGLGRFKPGPKTKFEFLQKGGKNGRQEKQPPG